MQLASQQHPRGRTIAFAFCIAVLVGCGGSETTQIPPVIPDVAVASISVTGVPTTAFLVADSVTLVATLRSATGATLTDRRIDWSSSAPGIASVSATGQVRALREGSVVITAISGGQGATANLDIQVGRIIGEAGGAIRNGDSSFFLNIPSGIVTQPTLLLVRQMHDSLGDSRVVPGTIFSVGNDSTRFFGFSSLKLRFADASVPRALTSESMQLHMRTPGGWVPTFRTTLDFAKRTVDGSIQRGGIYAVRSMPVSRIVVTGINAGAGLYSGTSGVLSTELYDSANVRLPDRRVAWSSSAPTIVRVDSLGRAIAGDLGTATITATADGKSATTTVRSVISWGSDFTNATEWTTYQGSVLHSAFVEATIDPARLREIWTARPIPGAALTQATIGGGRVFFATRDDNTAPQRVVALNPVSGATLWAKTLGDVNTLNQPTYENGVLYVTSNGINASYLHSLRDSDGALRYRSPFDGFEGTSKAPVIVGNTVATPGGNPGGLYGFDLTTGARRFFRQGTAADPWTPSVYEGRLYTTDGALQAVNAIDGSLVSELRDTRLSFTTPAVARGPFMVGVSNGQLFSINLSNNAVLFVRSGFEGMPVLGSEIFAFSGDRVESITLFGEPRFTYMLAPTCAAEPRSIVHIRNLVFVSCGNTDGETGVTVAIDYVSRLPVWSYPVGGTMSLSASGVLYIVHNDRVTAISAF